MNNNRYYEIASLNYYNLRDNKKTKTVHNKFNVQIRMFSISSHFLHGGSVQREQHLNSTHCKTEDTHDTSSLSDIYQRKLVSNGHDERVCGGALHLAGLECRR